MPLGAQAFSDAHFGEGRDSIFLSNVSCNGTEDSLVNCTRDPIGSHGQCTHSDDAGVQCQYSEQKLYTCYCTCIYMYNFRGVPRGVFRVFRVLEHPPQRKIVGLLTNSQPLTIDTTTEIYNL